MNSPSLPDKIKSTSLLLLFFCFLKPNKLSTGQDDDGMEPVEHIFAFEGEKVSIDCLADEKVADAFLMYRSIRSKSLVTLYVGESKRADAPESLMVKRGSGDKKYDFWYIYNNVTSEMAGEYECDWTKDLDEGNHHLLVMKKNSLVCPLFSAAMDAGTSLEGITCSIDKTGFVRQGWLNDHDRLKELKFTITDHSGQALNVVYAEDATRLSATLKDVTLSNAHNGTKLECKVASTAGGEATCQTNAVIVNHEESSTGKNVGGSEKKSSLIGCLLTSWFVVAAWRRS